MMEQMAIDMMELAKAFAGPVATILASLTAVGVTAYFARKQMQIAASQAATAAAQAATAAGQKEIARSQRDIAHDRLKYDLFEKRYEIYLAAKKLIEYVSDIRNATTVANSEHLRIESKARRGAVLLFPQGNRSVFQHFGPCGEASDCYRNTFLYHRKTGDNA